MNFEKINNLLIKYFNGETSLEEDKILRGYFSNKNIDERLVKYQSLFTFLSNEKAVKVSAELEQKIIDNIPSFPPVFKDKTPPLMQLVREKYWWRMAAGIALLMMASWAISKHFEAKKPPQIAIKQPVTRKAKIIILDENTDPQMALVEVEKALMLVSKNMKKGTDETNESLQKVRTATKILRN